MNLMIGDCWVEMTQNTGSGLILATGVGKHTDKFIGKLIVNTEGKTDCKQWHTDGGDGSERMYKINLLKPGNRQKKLSD